MNKLPRTSEQKKRISDSQKKYWEGLSDQQKQSIKAKRLASRLKGWEELKAFRKLMSSIKDNSEIEPDNLRDNYKLIDKVIH